MCWGVVCLKNFVVFFGCRSGCRFGAYCGCVLFQRACVMGFGRDFGVLMV